jgi:predicted outer membrane protein
MKFKHNKKRNTAFLFEALIKEMAKSVVENNDERQVKIARIIKRHFQKRGVLYKDLQTYKTLMNLKEAEEGFAKRILSEVRRDRDRLNRGKVFTEQSKLIKRINVELGQDVYTNFVPNYKTMATIAQLFSENVPAEEKILLEDRILEEMTRAELKTEKEIMEHIDSIAYKTFTNKFNKTYAGKLHEEQQKVVSRYIFSVSDNGVSLNTYLNEEIERLRDRVNASLQLEDVKNDEHMTAKTQEVLDFLDGLKNKKLDERAIKKIMQVQELVREVESNE